MTRLVKFTLIGIAALAALGALLVIGAITTASWMSGCKISDTNRDEHLKVITAEMHEPLPASARVVAFACEGFQDILITSEVHFAREDAASLQIALDATYQSDQNHPLLPDARKRRDAQRKGATQIILYHLPGAGALHVRNIELHIPDDPTLPARLIFEGWQF